MKIRVGDTVVVIAGKDKGKTGEVLQVLAKEERVIVEGVNMVTKHVKPSQADPEGGIVNKEAPIHVSNVAFYDSKSKSAVKLGYKVSVDENGNVVDGDRIMYVCGKYLMEQGRLADHTIVTTIMSNLGLYKACDKIGMKYEQTAVGDKYVYENMLQICSRWRAVRSYYFQQACTYR